MADCRLHWIKMNNKNKMLFANLWQQVTAHYHKYRLKPLPRQIPVFQCGRQHSLNMIPIKMSNLTAELFSIDNAKLTGHFLTMHWPDIVDLL